MWLGQCCQLYNAALEQRITWYRQSGKSITRYEQHVQLTEIRQSDKEWSNVPALVHRSALSRLDEAFRGFFSRLKAGSTPGFPRFRSFKRYDTFACGVTKVNKNRVHIPKLGHVKLNLYRPIQGIIKDTKITKDRTGKWWISFNCYIGDPPPKAAVQSMIGIDLGLKSFAVLSNGEEIANPRYYRESEDRLAEAQRKLSRKQKGSKSRERQRRYVAKINQHIQNQRLDFARKTAKSLFTDYDLIAYEDLKIKNIMQNNRLSKSIQDVSWGKFIECLTYKAEEAGKWLIPVDPRNTSQNCSGCGLKVTKALGERTHDCPGCGLVLDRDHNAAINVLQKARLAPGFNTEVS